MKPVEISFILWFMPFDLRRIRKTIRQQESQGRQLADVVSPSLLHQKLTLRFAERDAPPPTEVRYAHGPRRTNIEGFKILATVVDDYLWIPFGYYYFLERDMV